MLVIVLLIKLPVFNFDSFAFDADKLLVVDKDFWLLLGYKRVNLSDIESVDWILPHREWLQQQGMLEDESA